MRLPIVFVAPVFAALAASSVTAQDTGPVVTVISHPVEDYAAWRVLYDEVKPMRDAAGLISQRVLHAPGDPNMVILIHEFETMAGAEALFASDDLKAAMQNAGVTARPVITIGVDAD